MTFDFDLEIPRKGTNSVKYDGAAEIFGRDDLIPMWVADMDFAAPGAITDALIARAMHPVYGYTRYPDGMFDALIAWLKMRHGWEVEREWIVMSPGVVTSLYAVVQAVACDSVVVQTPVYAPFYSCVATAGKTLLKNPLILEDGAYKIDFDHLEACAKDAGLMLLCSPHNPVGRVWHRDELSRILDIAQRHDLVIMSDEIHADLVYGGHVHSPLAMLAQDRERIITAISPSKTFNIPGLGLSALIVPNPQHRAALHQAFERLHVLACNPFALTAFEAAYREGEPWLEALLIYLGQTRDFVRDYLERNLPEIRLIEPEGTYLLWLDCRGLALDDDALCRFFSEHAEVGLSAGTIFGIEGSGFMRMNIGASRRIVKVALGRIRDAVCALRARGVP